MELGFAVPVSGSWATPANAVELGKRAEELGYSSLWTFQRLLSPLDGDAPVLAPPYHQVHDPLATLAFLAGQTSRARLGLAVVNLPYYAPVVLAKLLTTIDLLSGGRLDAGVGLAWEPHELAAVGVPSERRGARGEDYLRCLRTIWTEEIVEYEGPFYKVPRCRIDPKPVQKPHPPVFIGGGGQRLLRLAAREAQIVGVAPRLSAATGRADVASITWAATKEKLDWVRAEAGDRFDDLELNAYPSITQVTLTDDPRRAAVELLDRLGDRVPAGLGVDEILEAPHVFIGTIDSFAEKFTRLRDELGINVIMTGDVDTLAPVVTRLAGT